MFLLLIMINSGFFLKLYSKYFKVNYKNIIGYFIFIPIIFMIYFYNNLFDALFLYYIYSFLYLSLIIDINEQWISDLTIILILMLNGLKIVIAYFIYNKEINLSGMILMIILISILLFIEFIKKKELMGFGDLKLYFVLSLDINALEVIILLMISSFIGIIYYFLFYKTKDYFPFGPAIIIGYLLIYVIKIGLA